MVPPVHQLVKLFGAAQYRTFRCLWMLEELGVPYEHVPAHPWSKKAKQHHPLGKVPLLMMLEVKDGNDDENDSKSKSSGSSSSFVLLYESTAINTCLGEGTSLVPFEKHQRALYDQFVMLISTELDAQGLWIHRKHDTLGQYFSKIPEAVTEAKRCFDNAQDKVLLPQLMQMKQQQQQEEESHHCNHSNNNFYMLGEDFTAVDILYVHCLDWAKSIGWIRHSTIEEEEGVEEDDDNDDESHHHQNQQQYHDVLMDYWERCRARPAYQRVEAMRQKEQEEQKKRQQQQEEEMAEEDRATWMTTKTQAKL